MFLRFQALHDYIELAVLKKTFWKPPQRRKILKEEKTSV